MMGEGGQVSGAIEDEDVDEEDEEREKEEEEEEEEEEEGDEDMKSRFRSEKLGTWRRRCECIVVGMSKSVSV